MTRAPVTLPDLLAALLAWDGAKPTAFSDAFELMTDAYCMDGIDDKTRPAWFKALVNGEFHEAHVVIARAQALVREAGNG
jgi:hypothetical protein